MAANHESVAQWQDALLLHVVDRLARDRADAKYGEWVTSSSVITITYAQLANIINGLAWLLVEQLDGPGSYGAHAEVLAYVGANDVHYSALVLAANKAGYTIFTFQELRQTPMVVMHTSRSTGLPKPIIWTHETCTQVLNTNGCQTPAKFLLGALLIEPVLDLPLTTAEQAALIERIWPSIEESNRTAPAHARVEKSFVLVIPMDRRLIRAPKGIFMRGANISLYTEEIEKLYKNVDVLSTNNDDLTSDTRQHVAPTGLDGTMHLVRQQILAVTDWPSLDNDDNLFDRAAIVTPNGTVQSERGSVEGLLATYRKLIHHIPVSKETAEPKQASEQVNVPLTGPTGIVGTHLLQALLSRDRIARIFCLNRGEDGGRDTQYKNFVAARLPTSQLDKRVTFIKVNVESPFLGLYDSLRSEVNLIVHAAWPVNFNLVLSAFRPQLATLPLWRDIDTVQLPSKSSKASIHLHLGQISDSLGPGFNNVDFVPVDLLSDILVDLATAVTTRTADNAATVFNLRNLQLASWSTLLSAIVAIQPLQIVSPATWLASLRASSKADYEDVAANPAVKLLDFFESLWAIHADTEKVSVQLMVVEKALEASPAMRKLDAVKVEWMHKWVEEWVAARK
ncbi:5d91f239-33ea-4ff2-8bf0-c5a2c32c35ba [Sclerotinia trifoliorum]|uniref:5d91f239-33ea-4ff2-8bf0-c5a2c32c35ba n=1 Tax=Sclerotinia trifoliorum TaxID=28548 RepID=A0A8H2ZVC3_9HELO|nr:5d91f239-33ea-4ff2-8bf0-c5a2c32c35ba [Sclerotinia trifoliorum]